LHSESECKKNVTENGALLSERIVTFLHIDAASDHANELQVSGT
jgi:hypothetical protein